MQDVDVLGADQQTMLQQRLAKADAPSLKLQISTAFAAVTLALALVLGILAMRLAVMDGLTPEIAERVRNLILFWGFGAVLVAALLGVAFAHKIAEPIKRLTEDVLTSSNTAFPWRAKVYRNYGELEELSLAMSELASTLKVRDDELKRSERRFREAFELVGIGLTQTDRGGRFQLVNRRFCEMLGYAPNELIGRHELDLIHPDDRDADRDWKSTQPDGLVARSGRDQRYLRKDGSVLLTHRSVVLVRDQRGKLLYGLGSVEDISDSHATQEMLRALNASLKAIVETSPLAIYSVAPSGLVTLWNPAAEAMFGLTEAEVLGRPSPALGRNISRERAVELRRRVLAGETVHGFEITWDGHPNGKPIDISVAGAPLLGPNNEIVGVLLTCSDITQTKATSRRQDEQLRFTQELLKVIPNPIFTKDVMATTSASTALGSSFSGWHAMSGLAKPTPRCSTRS